VARSMVLNKLRTTDLEWTTVNIGYIMDYFGIPHIKSHMAPLTINFDMGAKTAAIPGTGDDMVWFTYSFDIARFVEAALDLPHWEQTLYCYGDKCTMNEVLRIAEDEISTWIIPIYSYWTT
jgi:nucleoside-diphosphate-sugar epimerase